MTKNLKKFIAKKEINFFGSKTTLYLLRGLHKGRPSYRKSLQPSKENIQHYKTWNFIFFLLLYVNFALLDPDPMTWLNPDPIRIRNTVGKGEKLRHAPPPPEQKKIQKYHVFEDCSLWWSAEASFETWESYIYFDPKNFWSHVNLFLFLVI